MVTVIQYSCFVPWIFGQNASNKNRHSKPAVPGLLFKFRRSGPRSHTQWWVYAIDARMVSHSIVTVRLDYCNSLLHGTSVKNLNKMQVAQNELARAVCRAARSASATELQRQLHWLPVHQRINYKLALLTYKTRSTGTPAYLESLLESHRSARTLWSTNNNLLTVPQLSLALSAEAFCVGGPTVWKSLPNSCKQAELLLSAHLHPNGFT